MRSRLYRGLAYSLACQLKKPQMQRAIVAVFNATLDKLVDDTILKLYEFEKRIRKYDDDVIDAEFEIHDEKRSVE